MFKDLLPLNRKEVKSGYGLLLLKLISPQNTTYMWRQMTVLSVFTRSPCSGTYYMCTIEQLSTSQRCSPLKALSVSTEWGTMLWTLTTGSIVNRTSEHDCCMCECACILTACLRIYPFSDCYNEWVSVCVRVCVCDDDVLHLFCLCVQAHLLYSSETSQFPLALL